MLASKEYVESLEKLENGKMINLRIRGVSMYPAIKDYDRLVIEPLMEKKINIGDILAVDKIGPEDRTFLIHRLIKIKKQDGKIEYYTKGDNSIETVDGPFEIHRIKGRVVRISRNNIDINLRSKLHLAFAPFIALLSREVPGILKVVSSINSAIAERRVLLSKLTKRIKNKDPLYVNAQELCLLLFNGLISGEPKEEAICLIQEGVRWNSFCDIAVNSARTVVILKNLKTLKDFVEIPEFVFERLENIRLNIISGALRSNAEFIEILRLFSQAQIKVIPLKGVILSQRLYGDMFSRGPSADMDLMIKESDRFKAADLLKKIGYQQVELNEFEAWQWHYDFSRPGACPLDLHWDITMMNRSSDRIEGFWLGAKRAEAGLSCYELSDEFNLLYLCVNLINSKGYKGLKSLFDIRDLVEKSRDFRWEFLVDKASEYKIRNSVFAALIQAKNIVDADVPPAVLSRLKAGTFKRLFINIFLNRSVVFGPGIRRRIMDGFLSYILFELLEADSLTDYLKIAKRVISPPRKVLELSLLLPAAKQPGPIDWQYGLCIIKRLCRASYKAVRVFLG